MQFFEKFSNMKPMKYYDADDLAYVKAQEMITNKGNGFVALEKRDGEWARAIITEEGVLIQSRSVSKVTGTYGDKTELVPHIVKELKENFPVGTVLLGELAFDDISKTSRDVGSILRCKVDKALDRQKDIKLHFYIFDCLAFNGQDLSTTVFKDRFFGGKTIPSSILKMKTPFAEYIHQTRHTLNEDFMNFAADVWNQGGEGIVIMRLDSLYRPGSRKAWDSLKIKKQIGEIDMKVIDVIEPNKLYEGTELENWQYFIDDVAVTKPFYNGWKNGVIVEYEGRVIKVSSGLTDEEREWLATDAAQDAINSESLYAAITGMEFTEDSLRHPVFLSFKNK